MPIRRRPPNPAINVQELRYQIQASDAAPRNILEEIVWHKETEVEQMRETLPLQELQRQVLDAPPTRDFISALRQSQLNPAVIAEVKKASPSKGILREDFDPVAIAQAYERAGATCLSVLTDRKFFQGSYENLALVRRSVNLPILCKEFVIYPYQMYQARAQGADAILLIAAILDDQDLQYFLKIAVTLTLTALIEVHTLEELDRVLKLDGVRLIGINNRNLENFAVDIRTTCELFSIRGQQLQARDIVMVSESGLHTSADLQTVTQAGARAVLIGEAFIKQPDPGQALAALLNT